jgi:hypothetical protein
MKKSVAKQLQRDQRTFSAPPKTHEEVIEPVDIRRVKSSGSLHPEEIVGAQRVSVRIHQYVPKKRKSDTSESSLPKRKELPLSVPKTHNNQSSQAIESKSRSSQTINVADSEAITTISNGNETDSQAFQVRQYEDEALLEDEMLYSKSFEKESEYEAALLHNETIFHSSISQDRYFNKHTDGSLQEKSHSVAVSSQISVQDRPDPVVLSSIVPIDMSTSQIVDPTDTKDVLQAPSISQIEKFNTNSEGKASTETKSQAPHLPEHESSVDNQPLTSKEHASDDNHSSWVYDPADFENTHHIDYSDTPVIKDLIYNHAPPIILKENLSKEGVVYHEPFYSKPSDLPRYPTVFSGKEFKLPTRGLQSLKQFKSTFDIQTRDTDLKSKTRIKVWTPSQAPPSLIDVKEWLHKEGSKKTTVQRQQTRTQVRIHVKLVYLDLNTTSLVLVKRTYRSQHVQFQIKCQ